MAAGVRGAVAIALSALVVGCAQRSGPPDTTSLSTWDGHLVQHGAVVQPSGFDAFGATTMWSVNWGCGSPVDDLDAMLAPLPAGSIVRTWAFQALAWNNKQTPQHLDWSPLDRVVQAAERHHVQLDLALSDQAGTCDDGHWHDQAWYDGGFRQRHPDDGRGLGSLSFSDWVTAVVTRYAHSSAVAIWEPVNEPEASDCDDPTSRSCGDAAHRSCPPGAAASLRHFFDVVGGRIHHLDPGALVGTGTSGGGQCGLAGDGFATVGASPGVDVLSYHDHGDPSALPSGLRDRQRLAAALRKPLIVGEVGLQTSSCLTPSARATEGRAKRAAAVRAGVAAWLPWWWSPAPGACGDDFGPGDPLLSVLHESPGEVARDRS